jgi:hypothetical protein
MRRKDLAGGFSQPLILVVLKFLEYAEDARFIDLWRPIAEHVKYPAPNVWVRVVSHLQKSIPNLRVMDLNFTGTQSLNSFAPQFGVTVPAQFEQARYL